MFLSNASIRRPVAMGCLIIALTLLGVNAYRKMGLEFLPSVDVPYITVVTVYPGATPAEIETDIAKRIEDAVVSIDGLKHVTSTCMENVCQNLLEFELEVDVDVAANDVREQLDLITNEFPQDAEDPKVLKFDINAKPIVNLALTGDCTIDEMYDYADNTLRDKLSVLLGVADVQLLGGSEREVHILLDRDKLGARGLTSMDVVEQVGRNTRTIPAGRLRHEGSEYTVKFDAEFDTVDDIGSLEIANDNGARCRIKDVGRVVMATEERRQSAFIDGEPGVVVKIVKKAEANAVRVVARVREALDKLRGQLPGGMELVWVTDDADFIAASVDSTTTNIIQGVILTAVILFLFLYNIRTTLIVAVTMPLTIVISLYFLGLLEYTLNASTLLAIGLSVGILVTNSIVVIESIMKRYQQSEDAREAARLGTKEVAVAVAASAGTNVVVLFPVATMGSQVGLFFGPFALTMVIVTLVSLFVSFTLTPILASKLLRPVRERSFLGRMQSLWNRGFERVDALFARMLRFFEKRRWAALLFMVGTAAIFVHALTLAEEVGFGFFPNPDRGEMYIKLEYPTNFSLEHTEKRVREVEKRLSDLPHLRHLLTTVGKAEGTIGRTTEGVNIAQILVRFVEKTEREQSLEELMALVRDRFAQYPNAIITVTEASAIGGQATPIELVIQGPDLQVLDTLAQKAKAQADTIWGFMEPDTTVRQGKPELRVTPKRPILSDLDVPAVGLGMALRANLEGIEAGTFKQAARNYDIVVKLEEEKGKRQVPEFSLPGAPGRPLVLSSVGNIEETVAPVQILRRNKRRMSKLYSSLLNKKPMGEAVDQLSKKLDREVEFPPGYDYQFVGEYEIMEEAQGAFLEAAAIAILLVFLVLAAILESFRQPFVILVTLPLGLVGMLWALYLADESISMFVLLGAVMLVGIVVNNAILIMDQLNQYVRQGVPRHEAMVRAAAERLRPIIMITLAAMLGMLPLAMATGIGSEMRTAIGISSIGGIAVSAALTLLVLPILYDMLTRRRGAKGAPHKSPESKPDNGT